MNAVYSARWHRVSSLTPRLSLELELQRQQLRGETWYLLINPASGRSVRLNRSAYGLAARMDGSCSVQQLWDQSLHRDLEAATQDELIDLLAQLREVALVQFDRAADFDALLPHLEKTSGSRGSASLLAWRVPLGNPTRLLNRLAPLQRLLFSRTALWLWLLAIITLLVLAVQNGPGLWAHGQRWMATPRFALLAAVLYLPIKLLHELAHGLAVRRWGGQVREAGVTIMLLLPVPYVNASAATGFAQRRARIAVSAAGIMIELALAALALPLWLWLDPGLARDCAFVTLVVAGVSTLLFNGNPLQRLDGYYILCDALDLPNLGSRSRTWWLDQLRRHLLGVRQAEPMPVAQGETPWLALYAPLSWLMIMLIASLAVLWIGSISFVLGMASAAVLAWQVLLRPIGRLLKQLRGAAQAQQQATRRWRRFAMVSSATLALVLLAPWPRSTLVQGVVWPADEAQLRVDEAGFVAQVLVSDGQPVRTGEQVLQLHSPQLQSEAARQRARVAALEAELLGSWPANDRGRSDNRSGDTQAELSRGTLRADTAARAPRRIGDSRAHQWTPGLAHAADLQGQFVRRGHWLGQVLTGSSAATVRVALPESRVRELQPGRCHHGSPEPLAPDPPWCAAAARQRRSRHATAQRGPEHAPWRRHRDRPHRHREPPTAGAGRAARRAAARWRLVPAKRTEPATIGERAWVRFGAAASPLALQLAQALRQQVLRRFSAQQ